MYQSIDTYWHVCVFMVCSYLHFACVGGEALYITAPELAAELPSDVHYRATVVAPIRLLLPLLLLTHLRRAPPRSEGGGGRGRYELYALFDEALVAATL